MNYEELSREILREIRMLENNAEISLKAQETLTTRIGFLKTIYDNLIKLVREEQSYAKRN